MDTDPEGSSGAARGAPEMPEETSEHEQNGLRRLFGHLFGGADGAPADSAPRDAAPWPGLGNLRAMHVGEVALPKVEIVAVPVEIGRDELVRVFKDSQMTRLPVYEGTLDSPLGLVHLKDFALRYGFNGESDEFDLPALLRPLIYAPPSMPIGTLLQKMQSTRQHMALVIDEYGGVDGLVTLEDLVEQVIGEIADEHDIEEGPLWREEEPGVWMVQARAPLDELEKAVGLNLIDEEIEEEVDTLGGLVFLSLGRVPARGEIVHHPSGSEFEVLDADPRRIKRVRLRLPQAGAAGG
mgnify:CR=1 FL=1